MTPGLVLTSTGHFVVDGRRCFTFARIEEFDPRSLTAGTVVSIDGALYRVRAVETNAIVDATGRAFSIMVDAEDESESSKSPAK